MDSLNKEIFKRVEYLTFGKIKQILKKYVIFANNTRLHGLFRCIAPIDT